MSKLGLAIGTLFAVAVSVVAATNAVAQGQRSTPSDHKTILFEGKRWVTDLADKVTVRGFKDRSALSMRGSPDSYVYLPDSGFLDGTIEVDIAVESRGVAGIGFRGSADGTRVDKVCFLFAGHAGDVSESLVQQAVVTRQDETMCVLRLQSSGGNKAGLSVKREEWFRARIVIVGARIQVFLNDGAEPVFVVDKMLDFAGKGTVGVWGRGANFADFRFTPSAPK